LVVEPGVATAAPPFPGQPRPVRPPRVFTVPEGERTRHRAFVQTIAAPLWGEVSA
jgi:DNA polymerase III subunit epsilon